MHETNTLIHQTDFVSHNVKPYMHVKKCIQIILKYLSILTMALFFQREIDFDYSCRMIWVLKLTNNIIQLFTKSLFARNFDSKFNQIQVKKGKVYQTYLKELFSSIISHFKVKFSIKFLLFKPCRGLFSRSSQKEPVPAWKLFGKVPAKDARESSKDPCIQPSYFDRGK